MQRHKIRALSWALYDWANSGFATTVMAGFFPLFFKQFYCAGVDPTTSTARLGWATSLASLAVAIMAPLAGAVADAQGSKKRFLLIFTLSGAFSTAALTLVGHGQWFPALCLYCTALFSFSGGNVFYDSLLNTVAGPKHRDSVSSMGFSLGYLGGGILLTLNVTFLLYPDWWGIGSTEAAVRISFLSVAVWWCIFSVPLFINVDERQPDKYTSISVKTALIRLKNTLTRIQQQRSPFIFLIAYWFYMDGVSSVIRMAVDYGLSIGLGSKGLISALLIVQFVGFPATLVMEKLARRIGTANTIICSIITYAAVTIWASRMENVLEFYLLAVVIGMVQGSIQALSRSLFSNMIPEGEEAELFGFYNIVGRFAAIIGPLLIGTIASLTGSPRIGILSLLPLFLIGGITLMYARAGTAGT